MFRQLAIGIGIAILGVAFLPKILPGSLLVLGLGVVLLLGIIGLLVF